MKYFVGIDPGLTGAVSILDEKGQIIDIERDYFIDVGSGKTKRGAKKTNNIPDCYKMASTIIQLKDFESLKNNTVFILLEKQQPMVKQGIKQGTVSTFKTGGIYYGWKVGLSSLAISFEEISARTWQSVLLKNVVGDNNKKRSLLVARRFFPDEENLRLEKDHNVADSLLIAEYKRRMVMGG